MSQALKSGISVCKLISTLKKKKEAHPRNEWLYILPKSSQAKEKPPPHHHLSQLGFVPTGNCGGVSWGTVVVTVTGASSTPNSYIACSVILVGCKKQKTKKKKKNVTSMKKGKHSVNVGILVTDTITDQ